MFTRVKLLILFSLGKCRKLSFYAMCWVIIQCLLLLSRRQGTFFQSRFGGGPIESFPPEIWLYFFPFLARYFFQFLPRKIFIIFSKRYQKKKKYLILHGWKSTEQKLRGIWKRARSITCFGDRTSRAFLIIASVSRTKITWSQWPITLWMWMLSTVLSLLVYSLTVAICTIS